MATKQQVQAKAKRNQCDFVVDGNFIDLHPPVGFRLGQYHTVLREAVPGWLTKSDIYDELFDLIDDLVECSTGCGNC